MPTLLAFGFEVIGHFCGIKRHLQRFLCAGKNAANFNATRRSFRLPVSQSRGLIVTTPALAITDEVMRFRIGFLLQSRPKQFQCLGAIEPHVGFVALTE